MTNPPGDAQRVGGRGTWIVALIVLAVVVGLVIWVLGGDRSGQKALQSQAVGEPSPTNRSLTDMPGPQGRTAPDSDEGRAGAGSPATTRETPDLNSGVSPEVQPSSATDTGRNAPAGDNRQAQRVPDGSLTSGPGRDPAPSAPAGRP